MCNINVYSENSNYQSNFPNILQDQSLPPSNKKMFVIDPQTSSQSLSSFLQENLGKSMNGDFLHAVAQISSEESPLKEKIWEPLLGNPIKQSLYKELLTQEINKKENFLVFYNGTSSTIFFLREIFNAAYQSIQKDNNAHFQKTRQKDRSPHDFLSYTIDEDLYGFKEEYHRWDSEKKVTKKLMSASFLIHDGQDRESALCIFNANLAAGTPFIDDESMGFIIQEPLKKMGYPCVNEISEKITKLAKEYLKPKILPPQLLQIFVQKDHFDALGFYAYKGGSPICTTESGDFIHQIQSSKELSLINEFSDQSIASALSKTLTDTKVENFYKNYLDSEFWEKTVINHPLKILQVRFLSTNPSFYDPHMVQFNEFYLTDASFKTTERLRQQLKEIFDETPKNIPSPFEKKSIPLKEKIGHFEKKQQLIKKQSEIEEQRDNLKRELNEIAWEERYSGVKVEEEIKIEKKKQIQKFQEEIDKFKEEINKMSC